MHHTTAGFSTLCPISTLKSTLQNAFTPTYSNLLCRTITIKQKKEREKVFPIIHNLSSENQQQLLFIHLGKATTLSLFLEVLLFENGHLILNTQSAMKVISEHNTIHQNISKNMVQCVLHATLRWKKTEEHQAE